MPILNKPSFITKLFSFRKTTAAANAPHVLKLNLASAAEVEQAPAPKQRKTAAGTHEKHKSIFARIASPFKALKKQTRSTPQIKTISKQIKSNMSDLKRNMTLQLQDLFEERGTHGISYRYTQDFMLGKKTFTDQSGLAFPKDKTPKVLAEHLTNFCGGNKDQASKLSILLTSDAVLEISWQLLASSSKLSESRAISVFQTEMDVLMMKNNTARIVITQDYVNADRHNTEPPITVKATIDVPRKNPGSITLKSVKITPKLTELT